MNKIYRVVWNKATNTYNAVQETAKSRTKSSSGVVSDGASAKTAPQGTRLFYSALASALMLASGQAMAAPITGTNSSSGNSNYCVYDDESQTVICGDDTTTSVDTVAGKPAKSVVLGKGATNTGESNIAVGISASSAGTSAVAVGDRAKATADQAIAVGQNAQANARWDVSVGRQAGWNAAAPTGTNPEGRNIAIGDGALKNGLDVNNNTVMGTSAGENLKGSHNVIIGTYANAAEAIQSAKNAGSNDSQINFKTRTVNVIDGGTKEVNHVETFNSVAIGRRALTTKAAGVAVGQQAKAFGNTSAAVGNGSRALGDNSVAMGNTANAGANGAIAIGQQANYQPKVVGTGTDQNPEIPAAYKTTGANSVAIGTTSHAQGASAVALGHQATATPEKSVAVGFNARAAGTEKSSISIGENAYSDTSGALVIGKDASAKGLDVVTTNQQGAPTTHKARPYNAIAIGTGANVDTLLKTGNVQERSTDAIAIGTDAKANYASTIAIGYGAKASSKASATAIGLSSDAQGWESIAMGSRTLTAVNSSGAVVIGRDAKSYGANSLALGNRAQVAEKGLEATWNNSSKAYDLTETGSNSAIAAGDGAVAKGTGSIAMGLNSKTEFINSTSVGRDAKAIGYNTTALGYEATAKGVSSVAIGDKALAGTQDDATHAPAHNRGVAIGVNTNATGETAVALGSNAESKAHRGTALGVLSKAGVNDSVALGAYSIANRNAGVNGADPLSAKQASADASVWTATHAAVSVGNDAAITDDPRQGATTKAGKFNIPKVTRQIIGVAAGSQDTDAVNVAQLKAAGFKLTTSASTGEVAGTTDAKIKNGDMVTIDAGDNIKITQATNKVTIATKKDVSFDSVTVGTGANQVVLNNDGVKAGGNVLNGDTITVNGAAVTNVNSAINQVAAQAFKPITFDGNQGSVERKLGEKLTISGGLDDNEAASNDNVRTVVTGDKMDILLADAPTFKGKVSAQGLDAGGKQITNVGPSQTGTDAVNKNELDAAILAAGTINQTLISNNTPFSYVNGAGEQLIREVDAQTGVVTFKKAAAPNEVYNGTDITIAALNPTSASQAVTPTTVGNIKAGVKDNDAVNVSQLKDVASALGGGAKVDPTTGAFTAPTYKITTTAGTTTPVNSVGGALTALNNEVVKPLTFKADAPVISGAANKAERKLGETLNIIGKTTASKPAPNASDFSDDNIGVFADGRDTLVVRLAKDIDLSADGSVTMGDTLVDNSGVTINNTDPAKVVSLTDKGLNNGGNVISNVASNLPATTYNSATQGNPSNATKAQSKPADLDDKKTNAATVGDVLNAGWNVQTNGNATDFVKPYDTVNFADGTGTTVTSETDGDKTTFKVNVNAQSLAETAQLPVVYTDGDGKKLYKQADGSFRTAPNGGGDLIDPPNVIASMQGPTGSTKDNPVKLANVAAGTANTDAVNVSQLKPLATALGTTVDGDGTITAPSFVVTKTDGSKYDGVSTVQGALDHIGSEIQKGISFTGNSGTTTKKLGDTFTIKGALADTAAASDKNIRTDVGTDGTMTIKLAESPKFGDVTVNADGDGKITGVADGNVAADSKDAVNGGQLHGVKSVADSAIQSVVVKAEGTEVKTLTKDDNALNIKGDDNVKVGKDGSDVKVSLKDVVTIGDTTTGKPVKIDGTTGTITGLTNKDLSATDFAKAGRAASEEQLKIVDDFAVKYDKDQTGKPNKDSITLAGTPTPATVNNDGKMAMTGGTALNNVASAGDYTKSENAYKAVNAGDLNNAVSDVKDAGMNFSANDQSKTANKAIHRKLGDTVGIKGGITDNATATSGENVITRTTADGNINIELAKNAKFDSVVAGGTKISDGGLTFVDSTGTTVTNSPSITKAGINAGNQKITGVAKGTADTDAVNVSQLNEQLTATEKTTTATAGSDKLTVKGTTTGNNTDYVIDLADSTKDSLAKADTAVQSIKVKANGADVTTLDKDNNTLDITQGDNITVSNDGGKVKVGLNKDVTGLDSLTSKTITAGEGANQVVLGNDGVKVGGNTYVSNAGLNANNKAISNVASNLPATAYNTAGANNPSNATTAQAAPTNADAIKNNAATVGDVLNAGWNVQTNGNATDFVKPYDTVNFADGTGTTVTSETDGDKTTFKVNVNAQSLAETAQLPVVYTKANGDKVYKHADGKFYDKPAGQAGATEVPATDIIASMQNPDGTTTAPTTLANVKAGIKDTDAVNVSQLKGVATTLGGGAGIDPATGNFTAPSYTLTDGDPSKGNTKAYSNVGDALTGLNTAVNKPLTFAGDSGNDVERKLGSTLNIKGGATGTLTDGNIGVVADGTDTLTVKLAKDIKLGDDGSVKTGNTTVNNDGVTIKAPATGGTTDVKLTATGLNNGGNTITNVAKGTADTDAVNVSQLKDVQAAAKAAKTEVKAGDNMAVTSTVGTDGQTIYTVATKPDVSFDSVTAGTGANQVVLDDTGVKVGGNTYVSNAGLNANDKKVTNVAKGDVSANSKDAINGSQLHAHGEGVKNIIGGKTTYDPATGAYTNADIGGTGKGNIHDAIASINTTAKAAKSTVTSKDKTVTVTESKNSNGGTDYDLSVNTDNTTIVKDPATGAIKANTTALNAKDGKVDKPANPDALATAGDIANAINNSGFVLTASASEGTVAGASKQLIQSGNTLTIDAGKNIAVTQAAGTITVATKDVVSFKALDSDTVAVNKGGALTVAQGATVNMGDNKVTGVADGAVTATSKDAINGSQLRNTAGDIANIIGGNAAVDDAGNVTASNIGGTGKATINEAIQASKTEVVAGDNVKVTSKQGANGQTIYTVSSSLPKGAGSVNYTDGNGNVVATEADSQIQAVTDGQGNIRITNLSNGVKPNDAVNVSQLYALGDQINNRIGDVERRAHAGIASAMAMENAPYVPGKYTYAAGVAYSGGESAVGLTLRKTADNGRWSLTGGVSVPTEGDPSVRLGISGIIK